MAILKSEVVPKNSGAAFELKKGQRLRIAGRSVVDFMAFNLHDLTERFDQATTRGVKCEECNGQSRVLVSNRRRNQFNPGSERYPGEFCRCQCLSRSGGGRLHEDGHAGAVTLRRHQPPRAETGPEDCPQQRDFRQTIVRLITSRFGAIARVSEKGCLNFLYVG